MNRIEEIKRAARRLARKKGEPVPLTKEETIAIRKAVLPPSSGGRGESVAEVAERHGVSRRRVRSCALNSYIQWMQANVGLPELKP